VRGITIIGPGRLGGALAVALKQAGEHIDALVYRGRRPAARLLSTLDGDVELTKTDELRTIVSPTIIVATQDEDLPQISAQLSGKVSRGAVVLHTSGSISSDVLAALKHERCFVGSIHPLASITSWEDGLSRFNKAYFGIEGDAKAISVCRRLALKLGGHPFVLQTDKKSLYHAAAVTAAGHVTALFDVAIGLMTEAGVSRSKARMLLQPLLASVTENLRVKDTPAALTGTFARGDSSTLNRHLDALDAVASNDEMDIYLDLAGRSIDIAVRAGLDRKKAAGMRKAIKIAKARER
jgi:predicted short-subunit dehydrogenase-like oxidoreductase (DUF2520 family)